VILFIERMLWRGVMLLGYGFGRVVCEVRSAHTGGLEELNYAMFWRGIKVVIVLGGKERGEL